MSARLAAFLLRHRWPVFIALLLVTFVAVGFAFRIDFDFTPQAVLAGNDDLVAYSEEFKETFGYEDAVLLVLIEATGKRDILDRRVLTWQGEIATDLAALPHVTRVENLATVKLSRLRLIGPPWVTTVPLVRRLPVDEAAEQRVRASVKGFELVEGALFSADQRIAAMIVVIDPDARDIDETREVVDSVKAEFKRRPPPEGYRLRMSGLPALRVDIVNHLETDQTRLLPVAGVLFFLVLALLFRCMSGTLVPMLAVGVGLALTIGALVATGQTLNIVSNILPVMLLIIGISNCVHIVSRYAEESERAGGNQLVAARRTMSRMILPCLLTYLTTAIGFSSLMAARSEALRDVGWQAAMGMAFLYLSTIIVMGTLLASFKAPSHGGFTPGSESPLTRIVAAIGFWVAQHPRITLALAGAVVIGSAWSGRNVVVNSYMIETYDEGHPTIETMRMVENHLGGFISLDISLTADEPGRFRDPLVYRHIADAEAFALEQDSVLFTRSYVDLQQEVYANLRRRAELRDELPSLDENGRRRIRRVERLSRRVADMLDYDAYITGDGQRARVLIRMRDIGTRRALELIDRLETKLAELFPPDSGVTFRLTGDAYINAKAMDGFIRDLFYALLGASVVVFAIIAILFGSMRIGLIAIPPNMTPLIVTLGYMGLRGYDMTAGNVIVFAISLGVAVDDTIHFLSRFREEAKRTDDTAVNIRRAFRSTGRAIVLTTVLIVSGLAILHGSDFVPTRRFAELTSVTMAAALFGDLFLLPACLMLFWKKSSRFARRDGAEAPQKGAATRKLTPLN